MSNPAGQIQANSYAHCFLIHYYSRKHIFFLSANQSVTNKGRWALNGLKVLNPSRAASRLCNVNAAWRARTSTGGRPGIGGRNKSSSNKQHILMGAQSSPNLKADGWMDGCSGAATNESKDLMDPFTRPTTTDPWRLASLRRRCLSQFHQIEMAWHGMGSSGSISRAMGHGHHEARL